MHPLRVALAGFIDYAGLFPPASLDLARTVSNHRHYVASADAWLLGRLIVPAQQLDALNALLPHAAVDREPPTWTISALIRTANLVEDLGAIDRFNAGHAPGVAVVGVETVAASATEIVRLSESVEPGLERYIELPIDDGSDALLDAVTHAGCYAKLRTGGMSSDRFPSAHDVARMIAACQVRRTPFKATAGLHHPVRSEHSVTGREDGVRATMHGFVNVLMAAVSCAAGSADAILMEQLLEERNPEAFTIESEGIRWRDLVLSNADCAEARAHLLRSAGSCSFVEPIAYLRTLGWWPTG